MTADACIRGMTRIPGYDLVTLDDGTATFTFRHRGREMTFSAAPCGGGVLVMGMSRTGFRVMPDVARRWMADTDSRAGVTVGPRQSGDGRWRCFAAFHFTSLYGSSLDPVLERAVECGLVAALFDDFAADRNL